jgi:hypothetical protein
MLSIVSNVRKWHYYAGFKIEDNSTRVHWMAKIAIVCYFFTYFFQIIEIGLIKDDPEEVFEGFSVLSFSGMGILKLIFIKKNYRRWWSLLTVMADIEEKELGFKPPLEEYESDEDNTGTAMKFMKNIKSYSKNYQTVSSVIKKIYATTAIIFIFSPFIEYALMRLIKTELINWPHILCNWYVLGELGVTVYVLTIVIEIISAVFCVYVHMLFDITSIAVCIFLCGQFNLLRTYSKNIGGKGKHLSLSERRDNRAHYRIMRCHKIHLVLSQ